jgi:predicted anti-sigma-YlaC factor YlaD
LAGELDGGTTDAVGEHLSHCADCRAVTAAEQGLRRHLGRLPVPPPSPGFQERARAALNPPSRLGWLRLHGEHGWRRFTVPVLVAAVLLGLFILWMVGLSASQPESRSDAPIPVVTEDGRIVVPGGMNRERSRERQRRAPTETAED